MEAVVRKLLSSNEPSIRLKTHFNVLGGRDDSNVNIALRADVKNSVRVKALLSERNDGMLRCHPYSKWLGAHWILAALADLGYPAADRTLILRGIKCMIGSSRNPHGVFQ